MSVDSIKELSPMKIRFSAIAATVLVGVASLAATVTVAQETPMPQSAEQPVEQPAEQPVEQPVEQPAEAPQPQPAEQPAEQPVEQPAEQPAEAPQPQPAEQPESQPQLSGESRIDRFSFIGLAPNNTLVRFESRRLNIGKPIKVKRVDGNLVGIDFRPANGQLYGVTDTDMVYIIDPNTGVASKPVTLSSSANKGQKSGLDFNPQLDRLRFNGSDDQNFSIDVDAGTATRQTNLAYIAGDPNAGKDPNITAAAYDNNIAKAPATKLYGIDSALDVLALQDPPATGQLKTIGNGLGVDFGPKGGFDVFTDAKGTNNAFAVSGSTLYAIDLNAGTAKQIGTIPRNDLIGLAIANSTR
ncbi:DUF4394 domain-containing protein [Altericista sp. CCNU0014]|uniref:DUF4394 domain-containing protein n=1 Tax=Altericista sp. CCNU0014 TaxID=3082949 RepID=UPI00384D624E